MEYHIIKLRPAKISDLEILNHWDNQQHIIDSDPNDDWNWEFELGRHVSWREQLIAERGGRPIGFVQIIDPYDEESHYWGEVKKNLRAIDIWIGEKSDLGKGYGTKMMTLAIDRCFMDRTVDSILIDPLENNFRAHRFYEKLGFHLVGKRTFGQDACLVYKLDRNDWLLIHSA